MACGKCRAMRGELKAALRTGKVVTAAAVAGRAAKHMARSVRRPAILKNVKR